MSKEHIPKKKIPDLVIFLIIIVSDCPVYEISTINGSYGTCKILTDRFYVPNIEYCVDKCLDTPRCRGASYIGRKNCHLHDCDSYISDGSDNTFVQRSCKGRFKAVRFDAFKVGLRRSKAVLLL